MRYQGWATVGLALAGRVIERSKAMVVLSRGSRLALGVLALFLQPARPGRRKIWTTARPPPSCSPRIAWFAIKSRRGWPSPGFPGSISFCASTTPPAVNRLPPSQVIFTPWAVRRLAPPAEQPEEQRRKPAAARRAKKPAKVKPARPNPAQPSRRKPSPPSPSFQPKPSEPKPSEPKSSEPKSSEPKSSEPKSSDAGEAEA